MGFQYEAVPNEANPLGIVANGTEPLARTLQLHAYTFPQASGNALLCSPTLGASVLRGKGFFYKRPLGASVSSLPLVGSLPVDGRIRPICYGLRPSLPSLQALWLAFSSADDLQQPVRKRPASFRKNAVNTNFFRGTAEGLSRTRCSLVTIDSTLGDPMEASALERHLIDVDRPQADADRRAGD